MDRKMLEYHNLLSIAVSTAQYAAAFVREASGGVTDTDGSQDVIKHDSIVAGNPKINEWLLNKLEAA